ncbi:MAG TPA: glycosyltransferase [bacterium]|nr:glycosyltransferase [bacterium]
MKTAIVHDWLTGTRGGERILEALCEMFPTATIFSLLHVPGTVSKTIEEHPIRTSFVQHLPFVRKHYRLYLPLFPSAVESLDLSGYDLVLSVSHCAAKGAVPPTAAVSVCICLTPMRYAWDQFDSYFPPRTVRRALVTPFINRLRKWDRETSDRVQHFVAISEFVAGRIKRYYGRESVVIYPPVDLSRFTIAPDSPEDYYLIVSAFAPYKRLDIAIEAFKGLDRKLKIIGEGQHERQLRKMAPRNVEFLGALPDEEVAWRLSRCRALLFSGVEDFGIVPVEALASGRPVIAFAAGGVLETVEDGKTGVLFPEQTPASLIEAIHRSESLRLEPEKLREAAQKFDAAVFKQRIGKLISERMAAADRSREL